MVNGDFKDSKICRYCNSKFSRIDFPRSFNRMITCGKVECEGRRRRELWTKRYAQMMKPNIRAG